jgi:hypothetical protein
MPQVHVKGIVLSEICQTQKGKNCMNLLYVALKGFKFTDRGFQGL